MEQESILEIFKVILQFLGTLGMGGVMSFIITRRLTKLEKAKAEQHEEKIKQETERDATITVLTAACRLLLRSEMYRMCDKIKQRGYMFLYEQEQLRELLETYTLLKGNGTAHSLVEKMLQDYDVISDIDDLDNKK